MKYLLSLIPQIQPFTLNDIAAILNAYPISRQDCDDKDQFQFQLPFQVRPVG